MTTVAEFGDSSKLTVGETAIAIGSQIGSEYANTVTQSIVSSLNRNVSLNRKMDKLFLQKPSKLILLLTQVTLAAH